MHYQYTVLCFITFIVIVTAHMPGSFFWKPRVGLDLSYPSTYGKGKEHGKATPKRPSSKDIRLGTAVYIEGYQIAFTIVALAEGVSHGDMHPHLNMFRAPFYTNTYRWFWRHFRLLYEWAGGRIRNYQQTHSVWKNRQLYGNEFVPKWFRPLLIYVNSEEWAIEEEDRRLYEEYVEDTFSKHLRRA